MAADKSSNPSAKPFGLEGYDSPAKVLVLVLSTAFCLYHLYVLGIRTSSEVQLRAIHLLGAAVLAILTTRPKTGLDRLQRVVELVLLPVLVWATGYIILHEEAWSWRGSVSPKPIDLFFGVCIIALVLLLARRLLGGAFPTIALASIAYAALGQRMPGFLRSTGYDLERIIGQCFSPEGIFGSLLGVSAIYVFPFVLLGTFMELTKTGQMFINLANTLAGSTRGGPAKVAVVSSAFFGTISGSAVANVVGTGSLTIPMMIKTGYARHFAAAVEAVASTGGQIMPPIMASTAFLMAEMLGIPYHQIAIAAALPAILYFLACFTMVDAEAAKLGLAGIPRENLPRLRDVLTEHGHLILPLAVLVYELLVVKVSPTKAALVSVVTVVLCSSLKKATRLNMKSVADGFTRSANGIITMAIACAIAGIVVGMLTMTGLALKVSASIIMLSRGQLLAALVLTMFVALLLGMGLPTTASYVIASSVCAPALTKMGLDPLRAHLFIFYFSTICAITPPVALASYAAANIADESVTKVSWTAVKLGLAAFIVPYMFVYGPALLLRGAAGEVIRVAVTSTVGVVSLGVGLQGWWGGPLRLWQRAFLVVAALLLIHTGVATDLIGICLMGAVAAAKMLKRKTS
ncbi:MAG: TRAP transporter permease [Bacillota bacterium]